jgi:hypothetical protein
MEGEKDCGAGGVPLDFARVAREMGSLLGGLRTTGSLGSNLAAIVEDIGIILLSVEEGEFG